MQVNYQGIPAMLRIGLGLSYSKVRQRITKLGWSPSKALGVPDLVQEQVKT